MLQHRSVKIGYFKNVLYVKCSKIQWVINCSGKGSENRGGGRGRGGVMRVRGEGGAGHL